MQYVPAFRRAASRAPSSTCSAPTSPYRAISAFDTRDCEQ